MRGMRNMSKSPLPFPDSARPWEKTRVLVAGASGFVGSHLAARLVALGADVTALRSCRSSEPALESQTFRWVKADLLDFNAVEALIRSVSPEVVFHLAGVVNLERRADVAQACLTTNIFSTLHLLEAVKRLPDARLIFTSTTEVYGSNIPPFREDQLPQPPSPYAVSKLAAEGLCRLAWQVDGLRTVVVRMTSVYGPGQPPHRAVSSIIRAALTGEAIDLWHASQQRDWLYVVDAVEGLLAIAGCKQATGEVVNLGSKARVSQRQLVEAVGRLLGVDVPVRFHEEPRRRGEAPVWFTDSSRALAWCGWQPRYLLEEGLEKTIRWQQEQMSLSQVA